MSAPDESPQLVRSLTLTHTTALVVGTVIGTGVFLKTAIMAQDTGSPALVLAAWQVTGDVIPEPPSDDVEAERALARKAKMRKQLEKDWWE